MTAPIALLIAALAAGPSPTEHAEIELDLEAGGERWSCFVDQTPPPHGKNPRPVAKAAPGAAIRVRYLVTNIYPHETLKDVIVHFFVAPIGAVGQAELPTLGDDVELETAFDLDFRPGGHAGGRSTFRIDEPGVYLVRVETRNTQSDHEHFAAIDLVVGDP